MEYTILEIVKELNRIADIHKHPLTSTDERIANISFDYNDVDTKFNESERNQIVDTFIAIAKHYKSTAFGRIKVANVFHKCYVDNNGQAVWSIFNKGRSVIQIVFTTDVSYPISGHVCLVIGNTTFKGVKIKSAEVFSESLQNIGFEMVDVIKRSIPHKLMPTIRDKQTGKFTKLESSKNSLPVSPYVV
jgi:hypothetical protein